MSIVIAGTALFSLVALLAVIGSIWLTVLRVRYAPSTAYEPLTEADALSPTGADAMSPPATYAYGPEDVELASNLLTAHFLKEARGVAGFVALSSTTTLGWLKDLLVKELLPRERRHVRMLKDALLRSGFPVPEPPTGPDPVDAHAWADQIIRCQVNGVQIELTRELQPRLHIFPPNLRADLEAYTGESSLRPST